ncbi:MAG: radical SAM protein [Nanoarchaeota archaeon]|nr:radical SAM protein [Nanoarchaeota archaeon]
MEITNCDWEITTGCNLSCKHCIINCKPEIELSTTQCFYAIDKLKEFGCKQINFTGGEALFRNDFPEILKYSFEKGIVNTVFTNGILLKKEILDKIKKYVTYFAISLEGPQEENDSIRGSGTFTKTLVAIRLLKMENIPFGIHITLTSKNYSSLNKTLNLIKELEPFNISINQLVLKGRALENKEELDLDINVDKILSIVREIFPEEEFSKDKGCKAKPSSIVLTSEGNIYSCTEIRQNCPARNIGNILDDTPKKESEIVYNSCKCPYYSYNSRRISINFLTGDGCAALEEDNWGDQELFPGIGEICKNCTICCKTYGWLTSSESRMFVEQKIPTVKFNGCVSCIDSFDKDSTGERILEEIPICRFYKNERCLIQDKKPLDCQLFPIKIKVRNGNVFLGLSRDCKYISSLSENEKEALYLRVIRYLKHNLDGKLKDYLDLRVEVDKISMPKDFAMKEIVSLSQKKGGWIIEETLV